MRLFLATLALWLPGATHAACTVPADSFTCQVSKGRELSVCAGTEMFTYSFGTGEPPEMEMSIPFAEAEVTPWPGIGRSVWSSIRFRKGSHSYEVWASAEKDSDDPAGGGVIVSQNGKEIARIDCRPGTVEAGPEVFGEVMYARGFCWNGAADRWQVAGSCD